MRSFLVFLWAASALAAPRTTVDETTDISGTYHFHICDPMVDERLSALAVNSYDTVEIKPTTNALDICERAYRMNWRIENHMSTTLCILHNNHHDGSPNIRIDHVLTTKRMPADPHNLALENSLRNGLPLVESIEIDPTNDWLLLERKDRFCLGLQRIVMAGAGDDYEKLDTTEDNN